MYQGSRDQYFGPTTYSQHGEDLMICNIFRLLGVERPSYLDLGAHHPEHISNTALLYSRGSRGVNVEANPALMEAFHTQRPHDINICCGIAVTSEIKTFYKVGETSGLNSFDSEMLKQHSNNSKQTTIELRTCPLESIVEIHCKGQWPDFVNMDIEHMDWEVLHNLGCLKTPYPLNGFLKNKPKVFCLEVRKNEVEKFNGTMDFHGYSPLVRMGENLIYIDSELVSKLGVW